MYSWVFVAALCCNVHFSSRIFRKTCWVSFRVRLTVCVELFITVITAFICNTNHVKGCFGFVFLQILIWKSPPKSVSWASEPSHPLCPTTEALSIHRWPSAPCHLVPSTYCRVPLCWTNLRVSPLGWGGRCADGPLPGATVSGGQPQTHPQREGSAGLPHCHPSECIWSKFAVGRINQTRRRQN